MTIVAPLAETFFFGGLLRCRPFVSQEDQAVQIIDHIVPSLAGSRELDGDGSAIGRGDRGGCSCRPKRAAAAFFHMNHLGAVNADADGRKCGGHGGLLSSEKDIDFLLHGCLTWERRDGSSWRSWKRLSITSQSRISSQIKKKFSIREQEHDENAIGDYSALVAAAH